MIKKQKILSKIREAVQTVDPDAETILFGSRARGEERGDSDWDILILTQYPVDLREEQRFRHKLFEIELAYGQAISTFVYEKSEWESKLAITPLYRSVQQEGIAL